MNILLMKLSEREVEWICRKGEGSKKHHILWMSLKCRINSSPRGRGPERRRIAGVHIKVKEMGKGSEWK